MVKLTVDGTEVEVPKGTNLVEACKEAGVEVPHFCYHSHLSIAGNCRMCMVEVEGMRGLQIGCNTGANDGMVVKTTTDAVKETRAAVMEFLLVNHPIDCPVCDQAGECKLQIYYMEHDRRESVVEVEDKVKKGKAIEVGPRVMLDQERCVACSRCVRFCDEITETGELRLLNRGDHTTISTFPGRELDNDYSVNTVDICPVGALTSRDFRFQARVWYLEHDDSVCPGCATGCNTKRLATTVRSNSRRLQRRRLPPEAARQLRGQPGLDVRLRVARSTSRSTTIASPSPSRAASRSAGTAPTVTSSKALMPLIEAGAEKIAGVVEPTTRPTRRSGSSASFLREVFGTGSHRGRREARRRQAGRLPDGRRQASEPQAGALLAAGEARVTTTSPAYLRDKTAVVVARSRRRRRDPRMTTSARPSAPSSTRSVLAANASETSGAGDGASADGQLRGEGRHLDQPEGSCRRASSRSSARTSTFREDLDDHFRDRQRPSMPDWPKQGASEVFAAMAAELPELAGIDYGKIGKLGYPTGAARRRRPGGREEGLTMDGFGWLLLKAGRPLASCF